MVTFGAPEQLGPNTWRLNWTSDEVDPTYWVYLDGVLVSTQTTEEFELQTEGAYAPVVEVLDAADDVPSDAHPGILRLGWLPDADAAQYLVQQYDGAAWDTIATLAADASRPWWHYDTPGLADETTHTWRVLPVDAAGNQGTAVQFVALMVRHPDPPKVTFTYDGAGPGTVTIAAA